MPEITEPINRKVFFSRLTDAKGVPKSITDVKAFLESASACQEQGKVVKSNEYRVILEYGVQEESPTITLIRQRKTGLPVIYSDDRKERNITIKADEGLGEKTHAVWMPDGWIVHEYSHHGPRFENLLWFLAQTEGFEAGCVFRRATSSNPFAQLGPTPELTKLRLKLPKGIIPELKDINETLYDVFNLAQIASEADVVEIVVNRDNGRRKDKHKLTTVIKDFLGPLVSLISGTPRAKCQIQVI